MASAGRASENTCDRLGDVINMDWLQPRPAPAEEGIDWQGPEEARERRQEMVVRREHN
jgi:hypothetical protein